ncbi:MAG: winged helix-turn-helix transcriptional regulator [Candidatus Bipolaricaulia bacterium]
MSNEETSEKIRELKLLEALEQEPEARQVDLAARLGVAVGTVNWHLKRLAAQGYVKVKRIGQWHWRYLLTPQGMAEKARLTKDYVRRSMQLYRETRGQARRLLTQINRAGYTQVALEGDADLVDVCRLTCLEQGIEVVASKTDRVPVLRTEGQELVLEWPETGEDDVGGRLNAEEPLREGAEVAQAVRERLAEIIQRIVEVAEPEEIILFGSAARGEMGPNSDLDLLVVKAGDYHRGRLTEEIYMSLFGVGQAVDVIVVTPEDVERYRDAFCLVIEPALREGQVVYKRGTVATR